MPRWPVFLLLLLTAQAPITAEQPVPTATARKLDVIGLQIGQTPDQVRKTLARYDAGARVTERVVSGMDGRTFTEGVRLFQGTQDRAGTGYTMREDVEAAFSGIASGNRAIGIERRIIYVGAARIEALPVIDALREKYGPSPEEGRPGGTFAPTGFSIVTWRWLFGRDGQPLRSGAAEACPAELGQYRAGCPVQLTVTLRARDGKLEGIVLILKDTPFATAALAVDQQMAARDRATLVPSPQPPPRL